MRFVVLNIRFSKVGGDQVSFVGHYNFFTKETGEEFKKEIVDFVEGVNVHPDKHPDKDSKAFSLDSDIIESYYIDTEKNTKHQFDPREFHLKFKDQECYFCGEKHKGFDMVAVNNRGSSSPGFMWFCKKCVKIERIKGKGKIK